MPDAAGYHDHRNAATAVHGAAEQVAAAVVGSAGIAGRIGESGPGPDIGGPPRPGQRDLLDALALISERLATITCCGQAAKRAPSCAWSPETPRQPSRSAGHCPMTGARCGASGLRHSPRHRNAFGSTLGGAIDRPEQHWRARIIASPQFIAWMGTSRWDWRRRSPSPRARRARRGLCRPGARRRRQRQVAAGLDVGQSAGTGPRHRRPPRRRGRRLRRADGAECLTLWVADASARARAFYRRTGFRSTGRRQLVRPEEPDRWEEEQALDLSRPTAP